MGPWNWRALARVAACILIAAGSAVALIGCAESPAPESPPTSASTGQVVQATYKVSYYAAARFAEQATFGPTPALIDELRTKGFEQWIDEQFKLPFAPVPEGQTRVRDRSTPTSDEVWTWPSRAWIGQALSEPDQLRRRTAYSLGSFLVASLAMGDPYGHIGWLNLLHGQAFGTYRELLVQASINPHMGSFLNNDQNRPKSADCPHCAPNENYARELMQLFTIGVVKLNLDGTVQRDAQGRPVETYTQRDVDDLARVLTGWTYAHATSDPRNDQGTMWGNPMVPSTWATERDSGAKTVMGRAFQAGQNPRKDLEDAVDLLVTHPNAGPFVATRLIQQFVKSNPSPEYVERVARVFRDNGSGVVGDMKAVVKALLLDPEARRGDDPVRIQPMDGKFREPLLHELAFARGMGCQQAYPRDKSNGLFFSPWRQMPFAPTTVFGFYAPTDRAPGSNLLAPEQKLLNSLELQGRFSDPHLRIYRHGKTAEAYETAGCAFNEFSDAFTKSHPAFLDLISSRYFRGALPPTLRTTLSQYLLELSKDQGLNAQERMTRALGFALATNFYGVIK